MSSPRYASSNRKPGTGTVHHKRGRWYAFGPRDRNGAVYVGSFDSRREAEIALRQWLIEHMEIEITFK